MKTAQDERKIIGMTQNIVMGVKKNAKLLTEFARVAEQYARAQASVATTGYALADMIAKVAVTQHQPDVEKGIQSISNMIREIEKGREEWARTIYHQVVVPTRQAMETEKRDLPNFAKKVRSEQKRARESVKKAEDATKKAGQKNPSMLQTNIQILNDKILEAQQVILDQLKDALVLERTKYCGIIKGWVESFKQQEAYINTSTTQLSQNMATLADLAESSARIPQDMEGLISQKKRTLVDLNDLSSEWKKIFQQAGVSKADLQDEETARMILGIIEDAAIKQGIVPPSSLSALTHAIDDGGEAPGSYGGGSSSSGSRRSGSGSYDEDGEAEDEPPSRGNRAPPPPPPPPMMRSPSQQQQQGTMRRPPPPPPAGGRPPPVPSRSPSGYDEESPAGPPRRGAPPPPPRDGGYPSSTPPPPPRESSAPGGGGLLGQIRGGVQLKSAAERAPQEPAQLPDVKNFKNTADLTSILKNAMQSRRPSMNAPEDEDWGGDDDDSWSD